MRRLLIAVIGAVALAIGLAQPAAADGPVKKVFHGGGTAVLTDVCAFPVTVTAIATFTNTIFFAENGNPARIEGHVVEQDTYTANGKTLVGLPYTYHNIVTFDPQTGTPTELVTSGVIARVPLPGGGFFLTAGRFDVDVSGNPDVFILQPDVGAQGNLEGFCAALAP
jgi:hypothetical protein